MPHAAAAPATAAPIALAQPPADAAVPIAAPRKLGTAPPASATLELARWLYGAGATLLLLLLVVWLAAPPWATARDGRSAALRAVHTPLQLQPGRNVTAGVLATEATLGAWIDADCGQALQQPPLTAGPPSHARRWLLCAPQTGLNDALNQLHRCTRYAAQYGYGMPLQLTVYRAAELSDTFDFSGLPVPIITHNVDGALKDMFARGILTSTFPPKYDWRKSNKRTQLLNNLTEALPPGVLSVFATTGTGCSSLALLRQLRLAKPLRDEWLAIRRGLPARYAALHIRNTDLHVSAPIEEFVAAMPPGLPLVLATDDEASASLVKSLRPDVFLSSAGRGRTSKNLHNTGSFNPRILPEAVLDLLLLAHAEVLAGTTFRSGYSRLAFGLQGHPEILRAFVGGGNNTD